MSSRRSDFHPRGTAGRGRWLADCPGQVAGLRIADLGQLPHLLRRGAQILQDPHRRPRVAPRKSLPFRLSHQFRSDRLPPHDRCPLTSFTWWKPIPRPRTESSSPASACPLSSPETAPIRPTPPAGIRLLVQLLDLCRFIHCQMQ